MHSMMLKLTVISVFVTTLFPMNFAFAAEKPKLVLQITVDALRGDLLGRFNKILGHRGFRYLMEEGVYYTNAHYQHANTETIVGHTSLATGTTPSIHGMVGNVWFDRHKDRLVYNIEDKDYHLISVGADVDSKSEIDHTQKTAKADGRSPENILTSTLSDEMVAHFAGRSKIFAVSVKDRGAVSMAGHGGKAFWFSKASGEFVTSNYYYDKYPDWVNKWNAKKLTASYSGKKWTLLYKPEKYIFANADDRKYETDIAGFGVTFPHAFGRQGDKYFTTKLTLSPAGDEITLDFVKALLDNEQLGQDEITDFLAISFSSTDYVGHLFGASSLEMEDNIAHLDKVLSQLLSTVDNKVGLKNTLIVLSADHGQPEVPGYLNEHNIDAPHYFDKKLINKKLLISALKKRFGVGEQLIKAYFHPYIYLDHKLIAKKGLSKAAVEKLFVTELEKLDGIYMAVSSSQLENNKLVDNMLTRAVINNHNVERSGDIYLVFEPNVFINDFDGLTVASSHGSLWKYDTYVPIIFAGVTIDAEKVNRQITPYDIAPTIAAFLNMNPPSGATGKPLPEVLDTD